MDVDDDILEFEWGMREHEETRYGRAPSFNSPSFNSRSFNSPSPEVAEPDILPATDVDTTLWMAPITRPARFNPANPCLVSFNADTFRSGAEALIALLQYAHSPPGTLIECPPGVTFQDYDGIQPICFLDVRSSFHM